MARISGKDLAAIAALGVAGTMAYRDYNKKKEASAAKEAEDSVRAVAERPSLQTRQEALQKQADMESAERNYDYNPSDEEGRESSRFKRPVSATRTPAAPRVAPTRANANAAVAAATNAVDSVASPANPANPVRNNQLRRAQIERSGVILPTISQDDQNRERAAMLARANASKVQRVLPTISPEEQVRESAKFGNYPRRGVSAATNQSMSDMGIGAAMKRGGKVSSKPKASSASSRGDGIAQRGKTRGKYL